MVERGAVGGAAGSDNRRRAAGNDRRVDGASNGGPANGGQAHADHINGVPIDGNQADGNAGRNSATEIDGDAGSDAGSNSATEVDGDAGSDAGSNASSNTATELVGDRLETVDVSKHPDPTIPPSDLSLADIERRHFRPMLWSVFITVLLVVLVAPYWVGRFLAVHRTEAVVRHLSAYSLQGVAFSSWAVTVVMVTCLAMSIVVTRRMVWTVLFLLALAVEQFIGGVALLRFDFWYSTYVVYGPSAGLLNAVNLGIVSAMLGVAVFAVLFVGLLVIIRKESPLNVLTQGWASMILFFVIEVIALLIVLMGGLLAPTV